jgi:hypothetical protein
MVLSLDEVPCGIVHQRRTASQRGERLAGDMATLSGERYGKRAD